MLWRRFYALIMIGVGALWLAQPVAPLHAQEAATATPDEAGVIYTVVQIDDTMWAIAVRAGISLQQLLELNNLSEMDFILPGQKLIVGYGAPSTTPTPDVPPAPTPTLPPPTPLSPSATPPPTAVCLSAFQDVNGNGLPDAGEPLQAAVAFTVYTNEAVSINYITDGVSEPRCLALAPGNYQVTRSVAPAEVLTSSGNQAIVLSQGDVLYLTFGSRTADTLAAPALTPEALFSGATEDGAALNTAVVGEGAALFPTPAASGGQPGRSISLIPLAVVMIGGLLLTLAAIYFARARYR